MRLSHEVKLEKINRSINTQVYSHLMLPRDVMLSWAPNINSAQVLVLLPHVSKGSYRNAQTTGSLHATDLLYHDLLGKKATQNHQDRELNLGWLQ